MGLFIKAIFIWHPAVGVPFQQRMERQLKGDIFITIGVFVTNNNASQKYVYVIRSSVPFDNSVNKYLPRSKVLIEIKKPPINASFEPSLTKKFFKILRQRRFCHQNNPPLLIELDPLIYPSFPTHESSNDFCSRVHQSSNR